VTPPTTTSMGLQYFMAWKESDQLSVQNLLKNGEIKSWQDRLLNASPPPGCRTMVTVAPSLSSCLLIIHADTTETRLISYKRRKRSIYCVLVSRLTCSIESQTSSKLGEKLEDCPLSKSRKFWSWKFRQAQAQAQKIRHPQSPRHVFTLQVAVALAYPTCHGRVRLRNTEWHLDVLKYIYRYFPCNTVGSY